MIVLVRTYIAGGPGRIISDWLRPQICGLLVRTDLGGPSNLEHRLTAVILEDHYGAPPGEYRVNIDISVLIMLAIDSMECSTGHRNRIEELFWNMRRCFGQRHDSIRSPGWKGPQDLMSAVRYAWTGHGEVLRSRRNTCSERGLSGLRICVFRSFFVIAALVMAGCWVL